MKESDIYKLHQKYSTDKKLLEICWTHSQIVKEIALMICKELKSKYPLQINETLIKQGALTHDIGKYGCGKKNYVQHGEKGYEILIKEGFSLPVARFALTHVGVGIGNNIPISLEEEIVCYADSFHSKGKPRFNHYKGIIEDLKKFGNNNVIIMERFRKKFGVPNLSNLEKKYKKWHKEINDWVNTVK